MLNMHNDKIEELIDHLWNKRVVYSGKGDPIIFRMHFYSAIKEAISEASQFKWISVEERMPEIIHIYHSGGSNGCSDDVLISKQDIEGFSYMQVARLTRGGQGDTTSLYWDTPSCHEDKITHWMPLPATPKQ